MKNRVRDEFHFGPLNKLIAHLHSTLYACMHLMKWSNKYIFIFICFYWSILHSDDGHIFKTGMQISLSYKGICEINGHFRKKFQIFTIVCTPIECECKFNFPIYECAKIDSQSICVQQSTPGASILDAQLQL